MRDNMVEIQKDMRDAFSEIKEFMRLHQESQKQQTDILINMAKSGEKVHNLESRVAENREDVSAVRREFLECKKVTDDRVRKIETTVCTPSGVKLATGGRKNDSKLDKGQVSLLVGALAGFLAFMERIIGMLLDIIKSGPTP
jgi:hypothetical protein